MTPQSSLRAMLNGDDQIRFRSSCFSFPSSAMGMPSYTSLFPMFPGVRAIRCNTFLDINRPHLGFVCEENPSSNLDQAAQLSEEVLPERHFSETAAADLTFDTQQRYLRATNPNPPSTTLQEQQVQLRERMQYLSSLVNNSPEGQSVEAKRSSGVKKTLEPSNIQESWINKRQRMDSPSSRSSSEQRFRLYQAEKWSEKLDDLILYKSKHGHCVVPHTYAEDPELARWVKRQRYQYKLFMDGKDGSTMTEERIDALERAGFVWDSHGTSWETRFAELCAFLQRHGHSNVPSNYTNSKLATWVKCQRRQYKILLEPNSQENRQLSKERIQRLEDIGFEWELRSRSKKI